MSTSNNNLLSFLQNQSLFNNSPNKNPSKRMSSRSREKRSEQLWQPNTTINNNQNLTTPQNFNTNANFTLGQNNMNANFAAGTSNANSFNTAQVNTATINTATFNTGQNNQNFTTGQNFSQPQTFSSGQSINMQANFQDNNSKGQYQQPNNFGSTLHNQTFGQGNFNLQSNIPSPNKVNANTVQSSFQGSPNNLNNYSANLRLNEGNSGTITTYNSYQQQIVKHPGTRLDANSQNYLQSMVHYAVDSTNYARNEAMKRLDILAERVRVELSSLNSKLETFNSQMLSIVISEFNFVKNKVFEILQESFIQNEKYCKSYISTTESEFNADVLRARVALQRESENIALMKIDINKPHWQSNAVFVSVEFQARVNQVISQVKTLEVKSVQTQSYQSSQTWSMNLKRDLLDRVIARLQKQRELAFGRGI